MPNWLFLVYYFSRQKKGDHGPNGKACKRGKRAAHSKNNLSLLLCERTRKESPPIPSPPENEVQKAFLLLLIILSKTTFWRQLQPPYVPRLTGPHFTPARSWQTRSYQSDPRPLKQERQSSRSIQNPIMHDLRHLFGLWVLMVTLTR